MKNKLLKLKEELQNLSGYKKDEVDLKRIREALKMYVDIIFPDEKDNWRSLIWNVNFAPRLISDGMFGFMYDQDRGEFQKGKDELSNIIDLIIEKMEIIGESNNITNLEENCDNKRIFIVHGHDNEVKEAVAHTLTKLGLEPVILSEESNKGKTIIEKLEDYGDVGYAVVLLTPCDMGRAKNEIESKPRARQNVIAELGYFIGRLGRERVSIIHRADTDIPTDFKGLGYISYNDKGWKMDLARELKSANYNIDANNLI